MTPTRAREITGRYSTLTLVVAGDFCLDRYFEIDPALAELSIETGLPVHQVRRVRCLAGAAGTIVNNLAALGVGEIRCVGLTGDDGEGWALRRALSRLPGVSLAGMLTHPERQTFTYSKPLIIRAGGPPEELSRLDQKNFTTVSSEWSERMGRALREALPGAGATMMLEQVELADVGVISQSWFTPDSPVRRQLESCLVLADSRRGLQGWPAVTFKMNAAELGRLTGAPAGSLAEVKDVQQTAVRLAAANGRRVFVTLAERGIVTAGPRDAPCHVPALPVRGPIDVVGAGDAVSANLLAALAAGATASEAMALAMIAANLVVHQLGTTGVATVPDLLQALG